jgi:hypothetical protein
MGNWWDPLTGFVSDTIQTGQEVTQQVIETVSPSPQQPVQNQQQQVPVQQPQQQVQQQQLSPVQTTVQPQPVQNSSLPAGVSFTGTLVPVKEMNPPVENNIIPPYQGQVISAPSGIVNTADVPFLEPLSLIGIKTLPTPAGTWDTFFNRPLVATSVKETKTNEGTVFTTSYAPGKSGFDYAQAEAGLAIASGIGSFGGVSGQDVKRGIDIAAEQTRLAANANPLLIPAAFTVGAGQAILERPVDAAVIAVEMFVGGELFRGVEGVGVAAQGTKFAAEHPAVVNAVRFAWNKGLPVAMTSIYGYSVAERSTSGFSDFKPGNVSSKVGGMFSTEMVPGYLGFYAGYNRASLVDSASKKLTTMREDLAISRMGSNNMYGGVPDPFIPSRSSKWSAEQRHTPGARVNLNMHERLINPSADDLIKYTKQGREARPTPLEQRFTELQTIDVKKYTKPPKKPDRFSGIDITGSDVTAQMKVRQPTLVPASPGDISKYSKPKVPFETTKLKTVSITDLQRYAKSPLEENRLPKLNLETGLKAVTILDLLTIQKTQQKEITTITNLKQPTKLVTTGKFPQTGEISITVRPETPPPPPPPPPITGGGGYTRDITIVTPPPPVLPPFGLPWGGGSGGSGGRRRRKESWTHYNKVMAQLPGWFFQETPPAAKGKNSKMFKGETDKISKTEKMNGLTVGRTVNAFTNPAEKKIYEKRVRKKEGLKVTSGKSFPFGK